MREQATDHGQLTTDFVPKIADFGLAKQLAGGPDVTGTGQILGTPSYMSPEQATGRVREIGPATDVYSLGAILYRSIVGRPPFQGDSVLETIEQIRRQEPVPPRRLRPKLPRDLETICLKCLQKEPHKRYATADELAEDLRRFLAGEAIEARPIQFWERAFKWARRRPAAAGLIAMVVGVIALGFPSVTALWLRAEAAWGKTEEARKAEAAERDRVERLLYCHDVALAQHEYLNSNPERAVQLLEGCRADLRHWEWRYTKRLCQQEQCNLTGHTMPVYALAFSPDGSRLASSSAKWGFDKPGEVIVWDTTNGQRLFTLRGHPSSVTSVAFSPDGRRLASAGVDWYGNEAGAVKLWDMTTGNEVLSVPDAADVHSVAFTPDGQLLALGISGGLVKLCDSATGNQVRSLKGHSRSVFSVAFSPDGTRFATGSQDRTVRLWDVATGEQLALLPFGDVRCVAHSPDGRQLVAAEYMGTVRIWDVSKEPLQEAPTHQWHSGGIDPRIAFSPDGQHMALAAGDRSFAIVDPATGRERRIFHAHGLARHKVVAFSADGRKIATAGGDRTVKLWDLSAPAESQTWTVKKSDASAHLSSMAISPDGQRLALASTRNRS